MSDPIREAQIEAVIEEIVLATRDVCHRSKRGEYPGIEAIQAEIGPRIRRALYMAQLHVMTKHGTYQEAIDIFALVEKANAEVLEIEKRKK